MLRALGTVTGMQSLQTTHVAHVTMEIRTVDSIATLSDSGVRTQLLPQVFAIGAGIAVEFLDERGGAFHLHRLSCSQSTATDEP